MSRSALCWYSLTSNTGCSLGATVSEGHQTSGMAVGQVTVLVLSFRIPTPRSEGTKAAAAAALVGGGGSAQGRGWDNAQTLSWLSLDLPVSMTGDSRPTGPLAQKKGGGEWSRETRRETNKQTKSKYKEQQ